MTICLTPNDTHDTQSAYMGEYMRDLGTQLGGNQTGICFNKKETKEYISKMNENEDVTLKLNAKEEWNANEEFE